MFIAGNDIFKLKSDQIAYPGHENHGGSGGKLAQPGNRKP